MICEFLVFVEWINIYPLPFVWSFPTDCAGPSAGTYNKIDIILKIDLTDMKLNILFTYETIFKMDIQDAFRK